MSVAVITGGASGLGKGFADSLAMQGYHVVVVDKQQTKGQETVEALQAKGHKASFLCADLSDVTQLSLLFTNIVDRHTRIGMWINCAGFTITAEASVLEAQHWQQILDVNLRATVLLSQLCLQHMKQYSSGTIVNIASMFGLLPAPTGIAYSTTKHAVVGYTRTLEIEAQHYGINVHLVCPGFIDTNLFVDAQYVGVDKAKMLALTPQTISVEKAVQLSLLGIAKGKKMIVFPWYVRLLWWLDFFFPSFVRTQSQKMFADYKKNS